MAGIHALEADLLLGAVHPLHALHNKTAIDRSIKAVMPDGLIGGALIPCLGRFEAREFRDHDTPGRDRPPDPQDGRS